MNYIYLSKRIFCFFALCALIVSGCLHMPTRHQFGAYSEGEKHYAEGKYDKAIGSYKKYIDENPEGNLTIIAEYYIAKSQSFLNEQREARASFEAIIKKYPDVIWAQLSKEQLKGLSAESAPVSNKPAAA